MSSFKKVLFVFALVSATGCVQLPEDLEPSSSPQASGAPVPSPTPTRVPTPTPTMVPNASPTPTPTRVPTPPAGSGCASFSGYTLAFSTGYDTQADIMGSQLGNGKLSTTVYKTGPASFESIPKENVSSGTRSEVQYGSTQTPDEGCIEYDVMYEKVCQNNCHSLQYHPETSGGSASPGLWHDNGKFALWNWTSNSTGKYPSGMTIPTNKWMHLVLQYKFGASGYLKFSVDGALLINKTGIRVGDGSGQYLKVGVNMWSQPGTNSHAFYDNLKIYKGVPTGGGTDPSPTPTPTRVPTPTPTRVPTPTPTLGAGPSPTPTRVPTPTPTTVATPTPSSSPRPIGNVVPFGYGAAAVGGGNSTTVCRVTSLSASGSGSLSNCIGSNKTILFDVSGTINGGRYDISNVSYMTIDTNGHDVTINNNNNGDAMSLMGTNTHHIIIKGLRFTNAGGDGLNVVDGAHDILITNVSAYGNRDGNLDLAAGSNITVQNSILGGGAPNTKDYSGSMLITAMKSSVHHNLFRPTSVGNVGERCPLIHANYADVKEIDFRNNVVWKWGRSNGTGSGFATDVAYGAKANVVNNYYYTPNNASVPENAVTNSAFGEPKGYYYASGNISGNNVNANADSEPSPYAVPAAAAIPNQSACEAANWILLNAGPSVRNATEQAYVSEVVLHGCP